MRKVAPDRGGGLFAHVLANINVLVQLEVSQEGKFEPKPLYFKRLSDVTKIGLEPDVGSPETVRFGQKRDFKKVCKTV